MIIISLIVLIIGIITAFLIAMNNMESDYIGQISTLKLKIKAQENELFILRNEIYKLKNIVKYEPEI